MYLKKRDRLTILDAEEAEAMACREGIAMAARWPDFPMVETHSAVVADKQKSREEDRSLAWSILQEARLHMVDLCSLDVVKISRCQNNVAHELAHFGSGRSQVFFWVLFLILSCR